MDVIEKIFRALPPEKEQPTDLQQLLTKLDELKTEVANAISKKDNDEAKNKIEEENSKE